MKLVAFGFVLGLASGVRYEGGGELFGDVEGRYARFVFRGLQIQINVGESAP